MSVRVKYYSTNINSKAGGAGNDWATEFLDNTQDQREATVDGYTFHWGVNEVRNFLDDGVGLGYANFKGGATIIQQDPVPFGTARA